MVPPPILQKTLATPLNQAPVSSLHEGRGRGLIWAFRFCSTLVSISAFHLDSERQAQFWLQTTASLGEVGFISIPLLNLSTPQGIRLSPESPTAKQGVRELSGWESRWRREKHNTEALVRTQPALALNLRALIPNDPELECVPETPGHLLTLVPSPAHQPACSVDRSGALRSVFLTGAPMSWCTRPSSCA